ncbi:hypothetical protein PV325_009915 [Microctonus aethiopoides]|nr:hypothetical protein PV325_009915 [Microctonus aethiopoides]
MERDNFSRGLKRLYEELMEMVEYRFKQRIVRRRRDRLWIRRGAQTLDMEEERLLSHTMGDLEEYDFFGIRWMLDANWGLPHPSSGWHCPGLVGSLQELVDCEGVRFSGF